MEPISIETAPTSSKALIVCNGTPPPLDLLKTWWDRVDWRICADGGANFVVQHGLLPDVVVGDMDSLHPQTRQRLPAHCLISVIEQETNDADKAMRHCLQKNCTEVHLFGADGLRNDQFLANLDVLYKYRKAIKARLWAALEWMEVAEGEWSDVLPLGTTISLMPLYGPAEGITTQGLAYPLQGHRLAMGSAPSGVSNRVERPHIRITTQSGALLVIVHHQTMT